MLQRLCPPALRLRFFATYSACVPPVLHLSLLRPRSSRLDAQHLWVFKGRAGQPDLYMLSEWPASEEENWVTRHMELQAGVTDEWNSFTMQELEHRMSEVVRRHGVPTHFKEYPLDVVGLAQRNLTARPGNKWTFEHLKREEDNRYIVVGNHFETPPDGSATPILGGHDLVKFITLTRLYTEQQARHLCRM